MYTQFEQLKKKERKEAFLVYMTSLPCHESTNKVDGS